MEMLKRVKYTRDLYDKYGEFVLDLIIKNLRYMKGYPEDILLEQGTENIRQGKWTYRVYREETGSDVYNTKRTS